MKDYLLTSEQIEQAWGHLTRFKVAVDEHLVSMPKPIWDQYLDEIEDLRENVHQCLMALETAADGLQDCGAVDLHAHVREVIRKISGKEVYEGKDEQ